MRSFLVDKGMRDGLDVREILLDKWDVRVYIWDRSRHRLGGEACRSKIHLASRRSPGKHWRLTNFGAQRGNQTTNLTENPSAGRRRTPYLPMSLDASRPWICYWILHALSLLGANLDDSIKSAIAKFLGKCQSPDGGFGGGPGHIPHLAATYAAVNALVIIGTEEAYNIIDREKLLQFLWQMRQPDGSFTMHRDGEIDIRGVYCALSAASLTNVLTNELCKDTFEWIISCQTYEGGFSGCPGMEAHGGYAFCGLSALIILGKGHLCDLQALLRWTVNRQMKLEGGFQGRTNKLVDGCYSFWQGAAFPIIYTILAQDGYVPKHHLFDERALQQYILGCCQHPQGGLLDKPGKNRDVYHTAYTLSGLSVAQHFDQEKQILGSLNNEVEATHPVYNICPLKVRKAMIYFNNLGLPNGSQNGSVDT